MLQSKLKHLPNISFKKTRENKRAKVKYKKLADTESNGDASVVVEGSDSEEELFVNENGAIK